jgi:hypothetical protein
MDQPTPRRTLVVANLTASTPALLQEVERRARDRPTTFALLVPDAESRRHADWTLDRAVALLERAAHGPVEGLAGGADAFQAVRDTVAEGRFDDVLISTLPHRRSEWLRRDLPHRVEGLGLPVTVVSEAEHADATSQAVGRATARGMPLS